MGVGCCWFGGSVIGRRLESSGFYLSLDVDQCLFRDRICWSAIYRRFNICLVTVHFYCFMLSITAIP